MASRTNAKRALIAAGIAAAFAVLAIGSAATRAPWCDEAYFAEPAYQIIKIGRMATLVNPPSPIDDPRTVGTDRYIFWTLPLDIVLQAGWYRVVGFGMVRMRMLSMLWGIVALGAWWMILKNLGADARLRLVALALIALDYTFIRSGSEGRMDMMSAALGFLGIALFLRLQDQSYSRAVLAGSCCSAASAFTHPIGGVLATAGLGLTMLWYSRGRFRWWHPGLAAVPYLVLAAGWGIYIAQAPDIFRRQLWNITGGRLSAWRTPALAVVQEFTQRWAGPFGLGPGGGAKRIRALTLLAYGMGLLWALARTKALTKSGFGLVLVIPILDVVLLCFADSTKSPAYLVHVLPWLGVLLAILLTRWWRPAGALVLVVFLAIQVFGTIYVISRLQYQREFLAAIQVLRDRREKVTGDAQLGFGLGFQPALTDDRRLGFYTGEKTRLFVIDSSYQDSYDRYRSERPEIYSWVIRKTERSRLIFQNSLYRIYEDAR